MAFTCPASASGAACTAAKSFITTDLLGAFPRDLKQDVFLGKLDYQLNQSNHLSAVFNWQNWAEPYGYTTSPTVNNGGATQNGTGGTHERFFIANWTSTISATWSTISGFSGGGTLSLTARTGRPGGFHCSNNSQRMEKHPLFPARLSRMSTGFSFQIIFPS